MDKTKPISIQMRRLSDEFVYHFYPTHEVDGYIQYRRLDKNIIIKRHMDYGWVVWDDDDNMLLARPWHIDISTQSTQPPQCEWVSKKGNNSFVYMLTYSV